MNTVEQDMRERWKPTDAQMATAARMLRDDPTLRYVMVGLALPGKSEGWWTQGQPVEAVQGFWPTRTDDDYRAARDAADEAAGRHLAGRRGTSCYATIRLVDGEPHFAVFEGIFGSED
jgi:hypothetical protein